MVKISGKPTSVWMWKAPPPGELVPDLPPVDLTQQIKWVECEVEFEFREEVTE